MLGLAEPDLGTTLVIVVLAALIPQTLRAISRLLNSAAMRKFQ